MKLGMFLPLRGPQVSGSFLRRIATGAEGIGLTSIWLGEHVVLFTDYETKYPGNAEGDLGIPRDQGLMDLSTAIGFMAGVTSTIRFGTGICLVPQRNPVYTAKEMATADHLSDGRVDFGIGVGWSSEEFEACGVPWARRGARTDEYLDVMRTLWTDHSSAFDGEFYQLPACHLYPKPVQDPFPVHVGGHSDAAMRRTAARGQGWFGFAITPEQTEECLGRLDAALEAEGRDRSSVTITVCPPAKLSNDLLEAYAALGVDELLTAYYRQDEATFDAWLHDVAQYQAVLS